MRVVRPDIFDNIQRWVLWNEKNRQATPVLINLRDLKPSSRRHETLPVNLYVRARLVHQILANVIRQTLDDMVDMFCRDLHPQQEIEVWERIAVAYQEVQDRFTLSSVEKHALLKTLLGLSMGHPNAIEKSIDSDSKLAAAIAEVWKKVMPKPSRENSNENGNISNT